MDLQNKNHYALITGASSGIGYELSKLFAENGYNIIMVGRSETTLQERAEEIRSSYGRNVITIEKDLVDNNAAFEIYDEVLSMGITVNVLVNDAGVGVYGKFEETDIHAQLEIIQLNVSALTALTYLYLKDMKTRNEGKILQLASVASEIPHPYLAVYGGTKAFVLSFSEALVSELKGTNITVTALQPGPTDTDFFNKAGAENIKATEPSKLMQPDEVARIGYDALMRGDSSVIAGFMNKVQMAMHKVLPDTVSADMAKKQFLEEKKD